jgi:hypothetical protein
MKSLRNFIKCVLTEGVQERHLCLNGSFVPIESKECYEDVCIRIADAKATRDICSMQSDARDHYNGILKVLRRKHRKSKKFVDDYI